MAALAVGFSLVPAPAWGSPHGIGAAGFTCKILFGSTPSALLIPNAAPSATLGSGDRIQYAYQFQATNYSSAVAGVHVRVPTTVGAFPLAGGGLLQFYGGLRWMTVTGPGWTNVTNTTVVHSVTSKTVLASSSNATMTTQKIAVMATAGYGQLQLAFRWQWAIDWANGSVTTGPWSTPNATMFHPSILYPAPYVSLVSNTSSPVTIGTWYTANLSGAISKEAFFLELEHPTTGLVVQTRGTTAPSGNSTPFAASILINSRDSDLPPGPMLLHIHNHCGSMLYSIPLTGRFAHSAAVLLQTDRTACGTVAVNGTSYRSGSTVTVAPSLTALPIRAPSCTGHSFARWSVTGSLDPASSTAARTRMLVTYDGTLTAHYT